MNDLENIMSDYERHRQAGAKLNEDNKVALFDVLAAAGITEGHVDFDAKATLARLTAWAPSAARRLPSSLW